MTIAVGDKLPEMTLRVVTDDKPVDKSTSEIFGGRKLVLFGVPGAFTNVCTNNHVPGYLDNLDAFLEKGIHEIAVVSVNDPHVMKAWALSTGGAGKITFLADWTADFTKALGLEIDLSAGGLGLRSKRYSMVVDDGTVTSLNIEDSPGKAEISGAEALLKLI